MSAAHSSFIRREAAISAVINGVLSALFCLLLLSGETVVPVARLQRDAFPQSFMVALMACAVPTLLTRRRTAAGLVQPLAGRRLRLPHNLAARALLVAILFALVLGGAQWLLLPALIGAGAAFVPVLIAKIAYGALLGATVTGFAVGHALGDSIATP